jgi:hypothetical protein
MRRAVATGAVITLILMGIGWWQLEFLAGMDVQTIRLQKKNKCDDKHYVYGVYPKFNKETGAIERIKFSSTCADWAANFHK